MCARASKAVLSCTPTRSSAPRQIRRPARRANTRPRMADWTREKSGVLSATIRNLERGNMSIRSAEDVRAVFERGRTAAKIFMKNPLTTVSVKGGEIDAIFESQAHLARALGVYRLRVPRRARKAWQARH